MKGLDAQALAVLYDSLPDGVPQKVTRWHDEFKIEPLADTAVEAALAADREKALRDVFAGIALGGMIGSAPLTDRWQVDKDVWSLQAFHWADRMLVVRQFSPEEVLRHLKARGLKAAQVVKK